jgi:hypothetical protein
VIQNFLTITKLALFNVRGLFKYKPDTFIKNLTTIFFKRTNTYFSTIPAPLSTVAIAWAPSLCSFQKEFVIALPDIVA